MQYSFLGFRMTQSRPMLPIRQQCLSGTIREGRASFARLGNKPSIPFLPTIFLFSECINRQVVFSAESQKAVSFKLLTIRSVERPYPFFAGSVSANLLGRSLGNRLFALFMTLQTIRDFKSSSFGHGLAQLRLSHPLFRFLRASSASVESLGFISHDPLAFYGVGFSMKGITRARQLCTKKSFGLIGNNLSEHWIAIPFLRFGHTNTLLFRVFPSTGAGRTLIYANIGEQPAIFETASTPALYQLFFKSVRGFFGKVFGVSTNNRFQTLISKASDNSILFAIFSSFKCFKKMTKHTIPTTFSNIKRQHCSWVSVNIDIIFHEVALLFQSIKLFSVRSDIHA